MELELKINERLVKVKLLKMDNNLIQVSVGEKIYNLDIVKACENIYSVIYQGKSHIIDLVTTLNPKEYTATSYFNSYNIQIIDSQTKYQLNRLKSNQNDVSNIIKSPMPGKIVKINVKEGDEVKNGETLIIVEAMKMQSEYKAQRDSKIKQILVKEKDIINGNQKLIILE